MIVTMWKVIFQVAVGVPVMLVLGVNIEAIGFWRFLIGWAVMVVMFSDVWPRIQIKLEAYLNS